MQITFKYNNLEEATELASVVEQKFESLTKLLQRANDTSAVVEFKKEAPQQHGRVYTVESNLMVDGQLYRADATEESFEAAIDEVRDELDKSLRRSQKRRESLFKRGARSVKSLLQRG